MAKYLKGEDGAKVACGRILGFETDYHSNHYNGYVGTIYAMTGKKAKIPLCTLFTHNDEGPGLYAFDEKLSRKLEDIVLAKHDPMIDTYNVENPKFTSMVVGRHNMRNPDVSLKQLMNNELDDSAYGHWYDSCQRTNSDMDVKVGKLYSLMDQKGTVEDRHFIVDPTVRYGVPVVSNIDKVFINAFELGSSGYGHVEKKDSWHIAGASAYTVVSNEDLIVHPGVFVKSPYKAIVTNGKGQAINGNLGAFVEPDESGNLTLTHAAVVGDDKRWALLDCPTFKVDGLDKCRTFISRNSGEIEERLSMYVDKTLKNDSSLDYEFGVFKQQDTSLYETYTQNDGESLFFADSTAAVRFDRQVVKDAWRLRKDNFPDKNYWPPDIKSINPLNIQRAENGRYQVCVGVPHDISENNRAFINVDSDCLRRKMDGSMVVHFSQSTNTVIPVKVMRNNEYCFGEISTEDLSAARDLRIRELADMRKRKLDNQVNKMHSSERKLPSYQGEEETKEPTDSPDFA